MSKELLIGITGNAVVFTDQDNFDVDTRFRLAKEYGFDYLDKTPPTGELEVYQRASEKYSLPIRCGGFYYTRNRDEELLIWHMRIAKELGTILQNIQIKPKDHSGKFLTDQDIAEVYLYAYELGERFNVIPSFEVHINMWSEHFGRATKVGEIVEKQGIKFNLTALHNESTVKLRYSIISDTGKLFKIDTVSNILRLSNKPSAAAYSLQLRVTDNYGISFDKLFTFRVIQAPSKLLVNSKDTSYIYYTNLNADSAKLTLQLNATYDPVQSIDPVLTYKFVTGTGGDNNDLFDLAGSILINKRKLNDADTIKLRVSASDVYGLSVERFLYIINTTCPTKPSITVKASAVACLPVVVNLTDSLITNRMHQHQISSLYNKDMWSEIYHVRNKHNI